MSTPMKAAYITVALLSAIVAFVFARQRGMAKRYATFLYALSAAHVGFAAVVGAVA